MTATALQTTTEQVTGIATELLGLAVLAGTLAAIVALGYRWLSRERVPTVLALLVGLGAVAVYLNTITALDRTIAGDATVTTDTEVALFTIGAFLVAAGGGGVGRRVGDQFATDVLLDARESDVDEDVDRLVQTVGRVVTVTLPEEIDDVVGYDPVPDATRESLAGRRFVFPQNLAVEELRRRLVSRLKTDYGVGTVDIELAADGTVEYLAVGSRAAGIGATLPPATNAVAIRADPAFSASAGDVVQVWKTDPMQRVLTAELRGVAGDVVTIAIDAADTPKLDPRERYRLVTLPVEDRPDREFASLLRAADETFSTVTVEAGSPLHGMPVGALDLTVVVIKPGEGTGTPAALPGPSRVLAPGDVVFAIARPERLRRLDAAADPLDPSLVSDVGRPPTAGDPGSVGPAPAEPSPEPTGPESTDQESGTADGPSREPADADQLDQEPATAEDSTESSRVAGSDSVAADAGGDGDVGETSASSSFDDLKAEFEAGDAEWADDEGTDSPDRSPGTDPDVPGGVSGNDEGDGGEDDSTDDDLVDFANADISFEDDLGSIGSEDNEDDALGALDPGEGGNDDLLGSDDGEDDDLLGSDDGDDLFGSSDSEDTDLDAADGPGLDSDGDGDDDREDDTEDGDDGGGSKSFAQLKEEFESGEADWEDDISDSPGGDMRLDE